MAVQASLAVGDHRMLRSLGGPFRDRIVAVKTELILRFNKEKFIE